MRATSAVTAAALGPPREKLGAPPGGICSWVGPQHILQITVDAAQSAASQADAGPAAAEGA